MEDDSIEIHFSRDEVRDMIHALEQHIEDYYPYAGHLTALERLKAAREMYDG